jgi:hypothetical protein
MWKLRRLACAIPSSTSMGRAGQIGRHRRQHRDPGDGDSRYRSQHDRFWSTAELSAASDGGMCQVRTKYELGSKGFEGFAHEMGGRSTAVSNVLVEGARIVSISSSVQDDVPKGFAASPCLHSSHQQPSCASIPQS